MKKIAIALAALGFLAAAGANFAHAGGCPIGTVYNCVPYGSKMACGCH